jgi:DNA polymerase III gamma/tau subunit
MSLADVVGHERAVAALHARVHARRHDTGIILHGPEGVGKRTLARLYARAVLCEAPTDKDEACGDCAQCQSFIDSRPFGFIELDATKQGDVAGARRLVTRLKAGSLTAHEVVIVANADRYVNAAFDALLKTLEEPRDPTTFILLASTLTGVRLAGQSRCEAYRLRPLQPGLSRAHLRSLLTVAGVSADEKVLDVLVAETAGRVGRMAVEVCRVKALPSVTLTAVRAAFGLDWVEEVAAFWRAILSAAEPMPEALVPPVVCAPREAQRRVQAILLRLRQLGRDESAQATQECEAALLHHDALFEELSELMQHRAVTLGVEAAALWGTLAQYWITRDHGDAEGLRSAGRATRRLVVPAV